MRRRLAVCAVVAMAAATLGTLPFPQAASADNGIDIVSVGSQPGDVALLTVTAESGSPLASLTVHLSQNGTDVQDVSDFGLSWAGPGQQAYTAATPLQADDPLATSYLAPGTYTVTVDAADSSDEPVVGQPEGTFTFLIQPTVMLNPAVLDYTNPTVTFIGQVTGILPGDTTPQLLPQLAGQPVTISGPTGTYTGDTDTSGQFQIPAATAALGDSYQAAVAASPGISAATSGLVQVTEVADPVYVTASLAEGTVKYGQGDTISGNVTYQPDAPADPVPLSGVTVTIARPSPAGQPDITVVTGSNGQFTATLPAQKAAATWTVSAGGTALLEESVVSLPLAVQQPTTFRQVEIALSAFRVLSVKACLNVTSPGDTRESLTTPVTLQDERSSRGPWRNLQVIPATEGGGAYCHYGKSSWRATVLVPLASARYRLSLAASQGLQAAASKAVHLWRRPTRITSFKITPRRVAANGVIVISGRLWHHTASWHPYAGHKIQILFRAGGQWYIYGHEPVTNSGGYFSGRFVTRVSAKWLAQFIGDRRDFVSASPVIKVTVTNSAGVAPGREPGGPTRVNARRVV